jgi:hypothetical protein
MALYRYTDPPPHRNHRVYIHLEPISSKHLNHYAIPLCLAGAEGEGPKSPMPEQEMVQVAPSSAPVLLAAVPESPDKVEAVAPSAPPPTPPHSGLAVVEALGLAFLLVSCGFYSAVPSVAVITVTQVLAWLVTLALGLCALARAVTYGWIPAPDPAQCSFKRVYNAYYRGWSLHFGVPGGDITPLQALPFLLASAFAALSLLSAAVTLFFALLTLQPTRTPNKLIVAFPAAILGLYSLLALIFGILCIPCCLKGGYCRALPPGPVVLSLVGLVYLAGFQLITEAPPTHLTAWVFIVLALSVLSALAVSMSRPGTKPPRQRALLAAGTLAALGLMVGLTAFVGLAYSAESTLLGDYPPALLTYSAQLARDYNITAPDPTERGPWSFRQYTFGPEAYIKYDPQSPASIRTDTLDLSAMIPPHPGGGFSAFHRWFWGYSERAVPVAGRAYVPTTGGTGPRPVFLMIHGNALPWIRSEDGYAELLELLASHGVIGVTVAVEQYNWGLFEFLDSLFGSLMIEYDFSYRALVGLQALDYLRRWNATSSMADFHTRVQDNVVIGDDPMDRLDRSPVR